jgi:hypothetical protein
VKAHICIGGPLDGEFATSLDFYGRWTKDMGHEEGMYEHLRGEYHQFNNAHSGAWKGKPKNSVAWIHESLLKPSVSPRER